jgi:hypothetical protein
VVGLEQLTKIHQADKKPLSINMNTRKENVVDMVREWTLHDVVEIVANFMTHSVSRLYSVVR